MLTEICVDAVDSIRKPGVKEIDLHMVEIMTMQHRQVRAHYGYIKILLNLTSVTVIGPLLWGEADIELTAVVQSTLQGSNVVIF